MGSSVLFIVMLPQPVAHMLPGYGQFQVKQLFDLHLAKYSWLNLTTNPHLSQTLLGPSLRVVNDNIQIFDAQFCSS